MKATRRYVVTLVALATCATVARAQGPGVDSARAVARRIAAEGRDANADSLRDLMHLAGNFRDATVFEALKALASDPGNTPQSRGSLHDLAVRLAADETAPTFVRSAARCFYR